MQLKRVARAEWLPLALVPVLVAGYWLTESLLHTVVFDGGPFVTDLLSPPAHELWMRAVVALLLVMGASLWSASIHQRNERIRELLEYQERLRDITARLATADDEERREISERLHEHVAQTLSAARMFLTDVQTQDAEGAEALRSARRIVERAVADCRDIATQLSPPALHQFGLAAAVEEFARRVSRRTGIPVAASSADTDVKLQPQLLALAFQLIGDVVLSIVSDPRTSEASVATAAADSHLGIVIEWNAVGRDDFFALRERVSHSGGTFRQAEDDGRSRIIVDLPLA